MITKKILEIPEVRKFIFYALLIVFAAVCFYVVCPKWEYIFVRFNSIEISSELPIPYKTTTYQHTLYRHNKITNKVQRWDAKSSKWVWPNHTETIINELTKALIDKEMKKRYPGAQ
jgi:hypothetical protein